MVESLCNVCHRPAADHAGGLFCCSGCGGAAVARWSLGSGLAECASNDETCYLSTGMYLSIEQAIAAWNRRASGWVACAERMPEDYAPVLVWTLDAHCPCRVGWWDGENWWRDGGGEKLYETVTHWMPLPAPPEK